MYSFDPLSNRVKEEYFMVFLIKNVNPTLVIFIFFHDLNLT